MVRLVNGRFFGTINFVDDAEIEWEDQPADEVARRAAICRECVNWDGSGCRCFQPCERTVRTERHWRRGSCRLGRWATQPAGPIATSGRGIVTTAGGPMYFLNAYINFSLLREKGCTLPFEWAYLGDEMQPAWLAAAERIPGLRMIDLGGGWANNAKNAGGWQSKIRAVLASSFQEVLFLDADSFPRADPAPLFNRLEYRDTGVVFWQDVWDWEPDRVEYLNERFQITLPRCQCESGQLMFDKARAGRLLAEVQRLHDDVPDLYRVIFGDKDSWPIAALRTKTPFRIQHGVRSCRGGISQPDFDGKPFFAHLTNGKFAWKRRPRTNEASLPGCNRAVDIQQELVAFLGGVPSDPKPGFSREKRREAALAGRR